MDKIIDSLKKILLIILAIFIMFFIVYYDPLNEYQFNASGSHSPVKKIIRSNR